MLKWCLIIIFTLESCWSISGPCFKTKSTQIKAQRYLQEFLIKGEALFIDHNSRCLLFNGPERRVSLLEKLAGMEYPGALANRSGHSFIDQRTCRITLLKNEYENTQGKRFSTKNIRASESKVKRSSTSELLLSSGRSGELSAYGQVFKIKCTQINSNSYDVELSLASQNSLKSSVILKRGVKLEIANIIDKANNNSNAIDINDLIKIIREKRNSGASYQITIK